MTQDKPDRQGRQGQAKVYPRWLKAEWAPHFHSAFVNFNLLELIFVLQPIQEDFLEGTQAS
jgi:hypothetical protein